MVVTQELILLKEEAAKFAKNVQLARELLEQINLLMVALKDK
jgi:hypothetical protein